MAQAACCPGPLSTHRPPPIPPLPPPQVPLGSDDTASTLAEIARVQADGVFIASNRIRFPGGAGAGKGGRAARAAL